MRKPTIKHEYLRKAMEEIDAMQEEIPDETVERFIRELTHSCLLVAGEINGDNMNIMTAKTDKGDFGMLFTDMDELRKVFPGFDLEAREFPFAHYIDQLSKSDMLGYIINVESEFMVLTKDLLDLIDELPQNTYSPDNAYSSSELKRVKDSINNDSLEEFIRNPNNIGKYEELFCEISSSTLLTLMLSRDDLTSMATDGVISMLETGPLGFLYIDDVGGNYATVYTSEEKMESVSTPLRKYSQIVNFSQMTNFILNDDMDGIIINPNSENVMLTSDVLLEYSNILEKTCNDSRLNSAIFHMFLMEG